MKKKVISILLTAVLATGMAACGSNSNTAGNSANNTADNAQNTAETSTESTGSADSAEKPVFDNIEIFPSEKDDTDLMLAIKQGFESGCDDFLIFGATGGRVDHLLGNIQSLGYVLSCGGGRGIGTETAVKE